MVPLNNIVIKHFDGPRRPSLAGWSMLSFTFPIPIPIEERRKRDLLINLNDRRTTISLF